MESNSSSVVFRGQPREYPSPLLPSVYRSCLYFDDIIHYDGPLRLRQIGTTFRVQSMNFSAKYFGRSGNPEKALNEYKALLYVKAHVRNALGYPLAEALFQQAGVTSEGLDVTTSPQIALFFACFDWGGNGYVKKHSKEPSVIYKWDLSESKVRTIDDLHSMDFYSTPQLIPTISLLKSIVPCETVEECFHSVDSYAEAINWGPYFDLSDVRKGRPLHLLRLPKAALQTSRVTKQHALLMFPDMILTKAWLDEYKLREATAPIASNSPLPLIEDMAENPKCTKYCFTPDYDILEAKFGLTEESGKEIFPEHDVVQFLIGGWIRRFLRNFFAGTIPLEMNTPFGLQIMDIWDEINGNGGIRWFL